jgi:Tol biopolymer transport system component
MYPYRRQGFPWLRVSLIGLVVVAVVLAALFFSLPRVADFAPQGDRNSARAPISITFSTDMDAASVESHLHIAPTVVGAYAWEDRTLNFIPSADWPVGVVQVTLDSGATARSGLSTFLGTNWQFTVGVPSVAYLLQAGSVANLWSMSVNGQGDPLQITTERFGIDRFAISPDGLQFVYAALREDGGADLKRLNRSGGDPVTLLACPNDRCTAPTFSRDGQRLAFERHPLSHLEQSTVEVLDLPSGQTTVLDSDPSHLAQAPAFARDGRLAYLSFFQQVIVVHDFATNTTQQIPDASGEMGAWSPDGQYLAFPEITSEPPPTPGPGTPAPALQIDTSFSHIKQVAVGTGQNTNLSGTGAVEDAAPVYSPFGEWIVFGRKNIVQDEWTPGRQLWLMRADGTGARPLTNDPLFNNSGFVWSPDGKIIVYVRFDVTDPSSTTEIWSMSADGTSALKLVTGGYLPAWLP